MYQALSSILIALAVTVPAHAEETIKLSMGTTPMANIFSKIQEPFEKETGIKLIYVQKDPKGHGSELVFRDVDEGVAEGGAGGTSWDNLLEIVKDKNIPTKNLSEIKYRVIGFDHIHILTHKTGPRRFEKEQIHAIFSGKVKNMKEVGGLDQKIEVVLTNKQTATQAFFESKFLGQKVAAPNVKILKDASVAEMVAYIAATPGAVGIGPMQAVTADINVPEHTTIGRPITFIFRSKERAPEKIEKLLTFIKEKGPTYGVAR